VGWDVGVGKGEGAAVGVSDGVGEGSQVGVGGCGRQGVGVGVKARGGRTEAGDGKVVVGFG